MASTDARPQPLKNTALRVYFPIYDADGDLVSGAAGLDSEISKDGGTFADCTNEATEIASASGTYYLDLTSTEMNADAVVIIVKTTTTGAKTTPIFLYPVEATDIPVNVTAWNGTAVATPDTAGYPKVTLKSGTGTGEINLTSGRADANTTYIAGSAVSTSSAQLGVNVVNAGGTAWSSGAITAGSIAADAIGASELATDAVTEIVSAVWVAASRTLTANTNLNDPSAATIADAVWDEARSGHATAGTFGEGVVVSSIATAAITAAAIAADAIGASELATDAVTEIVSAVWAAASRTLTAATNLTSTGAAVPVTAGGLVSADVTAISTDTTAANNAESFFDGTGYAGTNNTIPTVTTVGAVSGAVGSVTGAVGSVTGNVGGNVTGSVGSLAAQAKTDVNDQVVDALATDTYAEPGSVPAATASLAAKIGFLVAALRNKHTTTASADVIRNDADSAAIATAALTDDGTTFTRGEYA